MRIYCLKVDSFIDMEGANENIKALLEKLASLQEKQNTFQKEINVLKTEINALLDVSDYNFDKALQNEDFELVSPISKNRDLTQKTEYQKSKSIFSKAIDNAKDINWEKFIGENLINKIGIIILILGVAIGVKYSIDHNLINPLTRLILGYVTGIILLATGIKLKPNYLNFSAVLISGAMAIFYFITFMAYDFYELIPQLIAFAMMVIFTIFTVIAALKYDKQVIAHIGLIGAYAVPFLLSNDSGDIVTLFSYISIINIGILAIAYYKKWMPIVYVSFLLSWLIYLWWFVNSYDPQTDFYIGLGFSALFFLIFYGTLLVFRLKNKVPVRRLEIFLYLTNAFIFYGIGYLILSRNVATEDYLGLFTLANATIHFGISIYLFKKDLETENIFYLVGGMVLIFITLVFPVQFDGNWVTLCWILEAVLLYWIGKQKGLPVFEKMAYPLAFLSFFSLINDWESYNRYSQYQPEYKINPILNIQFLSSVLVASGLGFIVYGMNMNNTVKSSKAWLSNIIKYSIPIIFLIVVYQAFALEISSYWNQNYVDSFIPLNETKEGFTNSIQNDSLLNFRNVWLIIYSFLFFLILSLVNILKLKNKTLGILNLGLNLVAIIALCLIGFYELNLLRSQYISQSLSSYYEIGIWHILIRYISFAFCIALVYASWKYIRESFMQLNLTVIFDLIMHTIILAILCNELMNIFDLMDKSANINLGLSILLGLYALFLIIFGMWKHKKHLRIAAIVLFGLTLLKLFFIDIVHYSTISKTIVFVALGILLLIISFLYNKYKNEIEDEF